MIEKQLHALKDVPVPKPGKNARASALAAAMTAFDDAAKKTEIPPQETVASGGLTLASTQTQRSRLMRVRFLNYKIAASFAVLVFASSTALYMFRADKSGIEFASRRTASHPIAPADNAQAAGDKIYEKLTPDGSGTTPPSGLTQGSRLEDRIDEALLKARSGSLKQPSPASRASDNSITVVQGEVYDMQGRKIQSSSGPQLGSGASANLNAEPVPGHNSPAGQVTADASYHLNKENFDKTQFFKFGAATKFGDEKKPHVTNLGGGLADADNYYADNFLIKKETGPQAHAQFEPFSSNPIKQTSVEPVSTFSVDAHTAAYGFIRRSLLGGHLPPKDAVRVEEMINYFPYAYPPAGNAATPFQPTVTVVPSPWKPTNKLVHIGIKGYDIAAKERPRANLVLLIDVSGSMSPQDRLPLLKNAFRMLLDELKPDDTVGIVTYANNSGVALEPTRIAERGKIVDALNKLNASGGTNGGEGLQDAYRLAEKNFEKNAVNRIILATDGDFNVGISNRDELKHFIEEKRKTGIYLSVIGVGHDNYNDRLMQTLAKNGNGVAVYVDTLNEARKVLVDEASSSLFPIANDVKIQVEFSPEQVSEYRLIGYETRALKREDFNNDKVDAGEIGSGHTVTAIYEITPVGAPKFVDDLRYQKPETRPEAGSNKDGELGFLKIRYKLPGEDTSKLLSTAIAREQELANIKLASEDVRFSVAVAAFGQLLRNEPYVGEYKYDDVIALAQSARGADTFGYRAEFVNLVRLAKTVQ